MSSNPRSSQEIFKKGQSSSRSVRRKPSILKSSKPQAKNLKMSGSTIQSPYFGKLVYNADVRSISSLQSREKSTKSNTSLKVKIKCLSPFTDYAKTPSGRLTTAPTRRPHSKKTSLRKPVPLSPTPKPSTHIFKKQMDTPPLVCRKMNLSLSPRALNSRQPINVKIEQKKKPKIQKKQAKRLSKIKLIESIYLKKSSADLMPYVRPFL